MIEYTPKTPPYTTEQKAVVIPRDNESPEQKLQRRIATVAIDCERYRQATKDHPEAAGHYETLIDRAERSLAGWEAYAQEQGVAITPLVVRNEDLWTAAMAEARRIAPQEAYKYED